MFGVLLLTFAGQQTNVPKVSLQDGGFVVSGALGTEIVPLVEKKKLPDPIDRSKGSFTLTVGSTKVGFTSKGLSIVQKGYSMTADLHMVPTNGKVATKESNAELMKLVSEKKRKLAVSALSGWELKGDQLVLLARWDGTDKRPWLEAFIGIDMSQKRPMPRLLAKFEGLTFGQGVLDDVLVARGDKLAALANKGGKFGLARTAWNGTGQDFTEYGPAVSKAKLCGDGATAWSLTATPYGTNILGLADLDEGTAHSVAEVRGRMKAVESMCAIFETDKDTRLINLRSGAQIVLKPGASVRQTVNGVLLWAPSQGPRTAALYDQSFRQLTAWDAPTDAPAKELVKAAPSGASKPKTVSSTKAPKKGLSKPLAQGAHKPVGSGKSATKTLPPQKPAKSKGNASQKPKIVVTSQKRSGRG